MLQKNISINTNQWFTYETIKYKSQGINLPELEEFIKKDKVLSKKDKFAFFDLDGTLITRLNGKNPIYSETNSNNWIFLGPILEILNIYNQNGYQIIIISNQSHFNEHIEQKINQISLKFKQLCNFEPIFICAIGSNKKTNLDNFRKPNIGIIEWIKHLINILDPNINFSKIIEQSFMCGDAVGINNSLEVEYQWSDVDYQFAKNALLKFIEPKFIFGSNIDEPIPLSKQAQLYILVGNQGSGKTTWAKKNSSNPCIMDNLKSIKQMEQQAQQQAQAIINMKSNIPIIIDATNSNREKRKHWINFAKLYNLTYTIVWIIRDGRPFNSKRIENKVPEIAYNIYSKYFEKPKKTEGPIYLVY